MKRVIFLILLIMSGFQGFSQTPGISYQAVILDPSVQELPGANTQNNILANSNIAVQFTIIDELNNQEYQEYHETSTDAYGMINLIIGHGNTISSNNFEDIVWEGLSKKLRIEIDFSGSRNSFVLLSDQELTFMPQPVVGGDAQVIIDNTDAIIAERNRAELAEANIQADVDQNETDADAAIATANGNIVANTTAIGNNTSTNSGVVTVHSDVSDAGSGIIISDAERTAIGNNTSTNSGVVTVHSDVTGAGSGIIISAAERTKLTNIEALADVTDAVNVEAAGAVMNTGDETISGNKTFSLGVKVGAVTYPNTDGTVNQVLQTNGSGVLTWNTPSTTATAYSGVLPLANGGTGSATKNFVDLTTNQTIAGKKTFSSNIITNGVTVGAGVNGVNSNTAIGIDALVSNTAGTGNVAIGDEAGFSITGSNNVAIGFATNRNAAEGDNNIAIGNSANYQGTSGANNISLGTLSYRQGNSGSNNIVLGRAALYQETTGSNNIALGNESSRNNNGGEGNITLGYRAGNTITTGDYNLVVGYDADVAIGTLTNATAIGNGAIVSASNTIQLGNGSVTDVITSGKLTTGAITLPNTDGTVNQVLQTNGGGVLSWSTPSVAAPVREVADEFSATASQTSFTLTQIPSTDSKVKMYINGIRISNTAYSVSGTTLTYVPANNGAYALSASDRIQFDFYY